MTVPTDPTTFRAALAEATAEQASGGEQGNAEPVSDGATIETPAATPETYKVKVDGTEVEVSLDEALAGYQRQASYTKGTQQLAAERQELQQAKAIYDLIESDPQAAIASLTEAYGVDSDPVDLDELDPLERDVLELKGFAAQQRDIQMQAQVEAEIARIQEQYNDPDLDATALLEHALDRKVGDLEVAYRDLKSDEWRQAALNQRAAEDAVIEKAKAAAAVVSGGTDRTTSGQGPVGGSKPATFREAFAQAQAESLA